MANREARVNFTSRTKKPAELSLEMEKLETGNMVRCSFRGAREFLCSHPIVLLLGKRG